MLWQADSTDRDFRDDTWSSQEIPAGGTGTDAVTLVAKPAQGYRAYLLEATIVSDTGDEYRLSTAARVLPDTEP